MNIVAGTNNLDIGGRRCKVASIIIYNRYNSTSRQHDIALVKTKRPFDLRFISILELRRQKLQEGDEVVLVGFGAKKVCKSHTATLHIDILWEISIKLHRLPGYTNDVGASL